MSPLMRLVLGLGALFLILVGVALGLPGHVTVSRSVVINASEQTIYPYLNNLHQFSTWSPWAARDPDMQVTYSGPPEGKGAKVDWVSNEPSIGTGSMEIVGGEEPRNVDLLVNYNGLEGTGYYSIAPAGAGASGSKVTWSFGFETGSNPMRRWKGLMLDGFVGAEYNAGLQRLRAEIEQSRRPVPQPTVVPEQVPMPETGGETVVPRTQAQGAQPPAEEQPPAEQGETPPRPARP